MKAPLDIAIVWHMHQPYYRASDTGEFEMPWVRMHAVKDYSRMVRLLDDFPHVHQTFNLVPSLVEQVLEYSTGDYRDTYRRHAQKPAEELTAAERRFLLETMCERGTHPRARAHARYLELAEKRDRHTVQGTVRVEEFTAGELRDVQIWFDLAWFSHDDLARPPLADLVARGRDFDEADKTTIIEEQARIMGETIPTYRRAMEEGRIEVSASPYFHPILPLLANTDIARVSQPNVTLPTMRFAHPEDAAEQVHRGLAFHEEVFGRRPAGMWCSEMGVGEDVIPMLADAGIRWTIADEAVLGRSRGLPVNRDDAGHPRDPASLYSAYRLEREGRGLAIVFRDRVLSDLVGFTYQPWGPADAAADLLRRLREARESLPDTPGGHLLTIALDGENAWEYYQGDGREMLTRLYEGLSDTSTFRCVTVSEHLDAHEPTRSLHWLHSGSWIGGDFGTWMGDRAHGPAWDLLHATRDAVANERARAGDAASSPEGARALPGSAGAGQSAAEPPRVGRDLEAAWREILIAEGSDWFWWFSDHQDSGLDHLWDSAFRRHLRQAYRLAGLVPPPALDSPHPPDARRVRDGAVTATLDGTHTSPEEWSHAISLKPMGTGTMQRAGGAPSVSLRFGWDEERLYLLIEADSFTPTQEVEFLLEVRSPDEWTPGRTSESHRAVATVLGMTPTHMVHARFGGGTADATLTTLPSESGEPGNADTAKTGTAHGVGEDLEPSPTPLEFAIGAVLEIAVPLAPLEPAPDATINVAARLYAEGMETQTYPSAGARILAPRS